MACSRPTVTGTWTATGSSTASSPNESIHDGDAGGYESRRRMESSSFFNLMAGRIYEVVGIVMDEVVGNVMDEGSKK